MISEAIRSRFARRRVPQGDAYRAFEPSAPAALNSPNETDRKTPGAPNLRGWLMRYTVR
jgi:hypothetical protein